MRRVARAMRVLAVGGAVVAAASCGREQASGPTVVAVAAYDLTTEDGFGWEAGVKQPVGAYQAGRSVHQVTRGSDPAHLFWVDETTGEHGVRSGITGERGAAVAEANPGGVATFGPDGTIWLLVGGRAHLLPPALFASRAPYDPGGFVLRQRPVVTQPWATSLNLHADGAALIALWRNGPSRSPGTTVRFRRADAGGDLASPALERDLGAAAALAGGDPLTIEQVWSRFDPRTRRVVATWHWYASGGGAPAERRFGSNPFLYSDDGGSTWRSADGRPRGLPIGPGERDPVLVPYDHLARGEGTTWQSWDLGVAPGGAFWTTMPVGPVDQGRHEALAVFVFADGAWRRHDVVRGIPSRRKSHAGGATRRYLVLVYADGDAPHLVRARASADDGRRWSAPVVVDALAPSRAVNWISHAAPTVSPDDDTIRFFLLHQARGDAEGASRSRGRWIKLAVR